MKWFNYICRIPLNVPSCKINPNQIGWFNRYHSGQIQQVKNWWFLFVFIFPTKQALKFHANCLLLGDNFHEMSKPVSLANKDNITKCYLLNFYPACYELNNLICFCGDGPDSLFSGLIQSWACMSSVIIFIFP